jgi:hypothetical protein
MPRAARSRAERRRPLNRRLPVRLAVMVGAVLILLGVPTLVVLVASDRTVSSAPGRAAPVVAGSGDPYRPSVPFFADVGDGVRPAGIGCSHGPERRLRAQAHLDVFADGRSVTVPGGIGVLPTCVYWLHTTADNGLITIGSPEARTFVLGDFFDIWGAPLTGGRLLSFGVSADRPLRAFVDGRLTAGDPRAIELKDGREIALVLGRSPRTVPASFRFPPQR